MKKLICAIISVALISTVFVACEKEDEKEPTYMVQVTAAEGGTVEGQNGEYKYGDAVVFTAIPDDGYCFSKWSDGNTDNPRNVKVLIKKDITLVAQFVKSALVNVTADSNGTISGSDNGSYAPGSSLSFKATPADGYYFSQWNDGNTDNPRIIEVGTSDVAITAEFIAIAVDLGLTSGTLWATCNVGAVKPWYYGDYYAWGEIQIKDDYSWETYKYCNGTDSSLTKYNKNADYGIVDNKTVLEPDDDVATVKFSTDYSMPTVDDWIELNNQCYWVWTTDYYNHNANGYIIYRAKTDSDKGVKIYSNDTPSASYTLSDAHIFLPAAGFHFDYMRIGNKDKYGQYWLGSLIDDADNNYMEYAREGHFESDTVYCEVAALRCRGLSIRPVRHKK